MTQRKRIILVEDDEITRSHLEEAIRSCPELELVATAGDVSEGRAALGSHEVDVLLTDLGLPDGSGIELIEQAVERGDVLCLVVTVFGDERHVVQAIEAGAMGYLLKDQIGADVGRAILDMLAGGSPISPVIARYLLRTMRSSDAAEAVGTPPLEDAPPDLSSREQEVLRHIVKGFTYAEIAGLLEISTHTASTHVRNIYRKLSVNSRGEAVYEAMQLGIVHPND